MSKRLIAMRFIVVACVTGIISGCSGAKDDIFAGLDIPTVPSGTDANCEITSFLPAATTFKVSGLGGTITPFNVGLSAVSCSVRYFLNGQPMSSTGSTLNLDSSSLLDGGNVLSAQSGLSQKTWSIIKNRIPSCLSQSPLSAGNGTSPGAPIIFLGNANDADGDPLSFAWSINNNSASAPILQTLSSANTSQGTFTPDTSFLGSNSVKVLISDGLDTNSCSWSVAVNTACSITSTSPAAATAVRVPFNPSTSTAFQAVASTGCNNYIWKLNGSVLAGITSSSYAALSSALSVGANLLEVSASNGASSGSQTWTIVKNSPPTCASQTPVSAGNLVGTGNTIAFNANGNDLNSDLLSFTWKDNGNPVNGAFFTTTNGSTSSSVSFAPDSTFVGAHAIQALISDGYDSASCSWSVQVTPVCQIASSVPSTGTFKMPFNPSNSQSFVATANDGSCTAVWKLNGAVITGATSAVTTLLSSQLVAGTNSLQAVYSNASSSVTQTWSILKNVVPSCASQSPSATGNSVGVGGNISFNATAGNSDSDPLNYQWSWNGAAVNPSFFSLSSNANTAQAIFSPNTSYIGTNSNAQVVISDGYDSASCRWSVNVANNCGINTSIPSASNAKVAFTGSTSNSFGVIPSDSSCVASWTLNGAELPSSAFIIPITSSQLTSGGVSNTLTLTLSNGVGPNTARTWNITKNQVPVCSSQTPATTGSTVNAGASLVFTGNSTDADNDPLTFSWLVNGNSVSSSFLSVLSSTAASQGTFKPDLSFLGSNSMHLNISDGLDIASCVWTTTVSNLCSVTTLSPSNSAAFRVAYNGSTSTPFQASVSSGCSSYSWKLNGVTVSGATTSNYSALSSALSIGSNQVEVDVTNGTSSDSKIWTVVKNSPPTCSSQSPSATGVSVASNGTISFVANGSDLNSDPLTFTWSDNGAAVNPTYFSTVNSAGTSTTTYTPIASFVGTHAVQSVINDGYDSTSCGWSIQVLPVCQIVSSSPGGNTFKMPQNPASGQSFVASGSDSSCTVTWRLNGTVMSGATSAVNTLNSGQLLNGPSTNALQATYSNGASTDSKTWTITKNQAPTCATQTPSSTGNSVGVGGNLTLAATAGNPDSDSLVYNWTWNGSAANPSQFSLSSGGNNTQAIFNPTASYASTNSTASVQISDGYDSASCSWSVNVVNNCSISSSFPATATYKVANLSSTSNSFGVIPSDSSCVPTWTLNGSVISSGQFIIPVLSSAILDGPAVNNLSLSLTNGVGPATSRTWNVSKNQVPLCSSQTPVANPTPMPYNQTANFTANVSDPDGDTLQNLSWKFNTVTSSSLFNPITFGVNTSTARFVPTISQVGTGQKITYSFDDGYDAAKCDWTLNVTDPNTVSIISCNPAANPVIVYSTGSNSTQSLQIVAANASTFQWYQNGVAIGGATSAGYAVSASGQTPGLYTYRGTASDSFSNSVNCNYSVKVNAPPVINSATPTTGQTYKMNFGSTLNFNVAASDLNSDSLTYAWTLDGAPNGALASGSASSILSPLFNPSLIGAHVISVAVSDGSESASQSWNVQINLFSNACNTMSNSPVGTAGGNICTLVGVPNMGNGLVPSADQTLVKARPVYMMDDGAGNWIYSDAIHHTVQFLNRTAGTITRFGKTIPAGKLMVIIGNGANGVSSDNLYNNQFKLNSPFGVAYDSVGTKLFVADYNNHRVSMTDNTGFTTTILGVTGGGSNNAAGNTDGADGFTHFCNNPSDVRVINWAGRRWLYAACSGAHAIKRVDIDPASGTYLKAYTVVGRLNAGALSAGSTDGTLGVLGEATCNQPWALADDGLGNIYWTESQGTYRVRMAATGGSAMSFFGGNSFPANTTTITASDTSGVLTAGTANVAAITSTISPNNLIISGSGSVVTSGCSVYKVQLRDASFNATTSGTGITSTITSSGGGILYSDALCSSVLSAGALILPANVSEAIFYYRHTSVTTTTLGVTGPSLSAGSLVVSIAAAGAATKLAIQIPINYVYSNCTLVKVQAQNLSNVASTLGVAKTIRLSHSSIGNFYSNSSCSGTPSYTYTLNSGQSELMVWYASTMIAPANQTASLFGNTSTNSIYPNSNTPVGIGAVTLRYPRGLAIKTSGSTVQGFFVSNWDQYRYLYLNNTASSVTFGGNLIPGYQAGSAAGTGVGGYNSDGIGNVTRVYTNFGLNISADMGSLLIPDYDNYRIRSLDLTIPNGLLTTKVGAGYARAGNLGDSPVAATSMYLNSPGQVVIDNTSQMLYVSDSANSRIRRVNLLSGYVDTVVGKGSGAAAVDDVDPTNAFMTSPRGLALVSKSGTNFLVYADQASNTSANQNCMIRALNLTPNISSPPPTILFGTSINPYKVSTVVGDYTLGCQSWNAAPVNTVGGAATSTKLYNPEGISSDGTNLYIADYNDHCILKVGASGATSPVVGTCGTAGTTDGSTAVAFIRFPTAVTVDPNYAADGNFFFADAVDATPSRIRYVNFRNTSVQIGSTTVPAATAPNGIVQTIWTASPSGNSSGRVFGIAAFGSQLCYAGGWAGDGNLGTHNVTCYDRTSPVGPVTLRVGPNEASNPPIRGGAPLDLTQENIYSSGALVSAPYGLAFDSTGNLYISERNNHLIRMVRRWW